MIRDSIRMNVLRVIVFYDKSRLNTVDCYIISARCICVIYYYSYTHISNSI